MIEKEQLAEIASRLSLEPNSLSKAEALAFLAMVCEEKTGIEIEEGLEIAMELDQLACINISALRQKLAKEIWGKPVKTTRPNAKDMASAIVKRAKTGKAEERAKANKQD